MEITVRGPGADQVSYLLGKNPAVLAPYQREVGPVDTFVLYRTYTPQEVSVAVIGIADPVRMVRFLPPVAAITDYVSDRSCAVSSFFATAIQRVLQSAVAGTCTVDGVERTDWVQQPRDIEILLAPLAPRMRQSMLQGLFEPLGYTIAMTRSEPPADYLVATQGSALALRLRTTAPLYRVLRQILVLIPVIDNYRYHWVNRDQVDKLLRLGEDWLADHPLRQLILNRYLKFQQDLIGDVQTAVAAAARAGENGETDAGDGASDTGGADAASGEDPAAVSAEEAVERRLSLHECRHQAVIAQLRAAQPTGIVELGCAQGRLTRRLAQAFPALPIRGGDASLRALDLARRLTQRELQRGVITRVPQFLQTSLYLPDRRLMAGMGDRAAVVLCEVIEHIDPRRLDQVMDLLFGHYAPATVILTTPNVEYNALFPGLKPGQLRHRDHRFEWTRAELQQFADRITRQYPHYTASGFGIGTDDPERGTPSQMAVFRRAA